MQIMEFAMIDIVWMSEIRSGMWRRNGQVSDICKRLILTIFRWCSIKFWITARRRFAKYLRIWICSWLRYEVSFNSSFILTCLVSGALLRCEQNIESSHVTPRLASFLTPWSNAWGYVTGRISDFTGASRDGNTSSCLCGQGETCSYYGSAWMYSQISGK